MIVSLEGQVLVAFFDGLEVLRATSFGGPAYQKLELDRRRLLPILLEQLAPLGAGYAMVLRRRLPDLWSRAVNQSRKDRGG